MDYFARDYEGDRVWCMVGGPRWSPPSCIVFLPIFVCSILVRGDISSVPGVSIGTTRLPRQIATVAPTPLQQVAGLRDVYRAVSCPISGSLAMGVPILHGLPSICCTELGYIYYRRAAADPI